MVMRWLLMRWLLMRWVLRGGAAADVLAIGGRSPVATGRMGIAATLIGMAVGICLAVTGPAAAQNDNAKPAQAGEEAAAADGPPVLQVELNTIEQQDDAACRVYLVVKNDSEDRFTDLEMELILFDTQGFVSRRYAVQIAPLQPNKTRVRPFDLPELDCDTVGQFLINDVTRCVAEGNDQPECLRRIRTESKGEVKLFM